MCVFVCARSHWHLSLSLRAASWCAPATRRGAHYARLAPLERGATMSRRQDLMLVVFFFEKQKKNKKNSRAWYVMWGVMFSINDTCDPTVFWHQRAGFKGALLFCRRNSNWEFAHLRRFKLRNINWINELSWEESKGPREPCVKLERWQDPPYLNKI